VIDAADGPALRRVRRLFLDDGASDGYEAFGWWDLQGGSTNADAEDAGVQVEVFQEGSDGDDDIAVCAGDYE
jgi:hypothetical protein